MFQWIEDNPDLGQVDMCLANAGFTYEKSLMEGNSIPQSLYTVA